jgi:nickel-dependent lactate racemase
MATFRLKYGSGTKELELPDNISVDIIEGQNIPGAGDPSETVRHALRHPLADNRLEQHENVQSVAIAINDKTRPVPHALLLPPLLEELRNFVSPETISFFVASGTHNPMPANEYTKILPENIIRNYAIFSHDAQDNENLTYLGKTSRGTPVHVNSKYLEADLKISVGNIEPHHFAGFSGGIKSVAIGLTGVETINTNHAMLTDPLARIGEYDNNPLRQDIEEIGQLIGVQFALNVILNEKGEIVHAVSGDPVKVMQKGVDLSRQICMTVVYEKYDIVIASPGGYPKDINLYQAQKALSHASLLTKDGGVVILVAECREGVGSDSYLEFMAGITRHQDVFDKINRVGFSIGPHKALQFARECMRINVILVTNIDKDTTDKLLLRSAKDLSAALSIARQITRSDSTIAILPRAINTIPQYITKN